MIIDIPTVTLINWNALNRVMGPYQLLEMGLHVKVSVNSVATKAHAMYAVPT